MSYRILSVGQCNFDEPQIQAVLNRIEGVTVESASSVDQTHALLLASKFNLVLLNRIFDSTGESGLELIKDLKKRFPEVVLMLVSNYADAQDEAVKLGAVQGFGKKDLRGTLPLELVKSALESKNSN